MARKASESSVWERNGRKGIRLTKTYYHVIILFMSGEIKYRKPRLTAEQKVRILTDYKSGLTIAEIEQRNKTNPGTIYRILKQAAN